VSRRHKPEEGIMSGNHLLISFFPFFFLSYLIPFILYWFSAYTLCTLPIILPFLLLIITLLPHYAPSSPLLLFSLDTSFSLMCRLSSLFLYSSFLSPCVEPTLYLCCAYVQLCTLVGVSQSSRYLQRLPMRGSLDQSLRNLLVCRYVLVSSGNMIT
jgi:hypothetical protein